MNSHPTQDAVLDELGDKVPTAIAESVAAARGDLAEYRELRPAWVADHTERCLANWIHDRVWRHLAARLDEIGDVVVVDREPDRSFRVVSKYLFRVKRHGLGDRVSTYPTQTALQFYTQGAQLLFPDMGEVRLAAGYMWEPEERSIGDAVISMRDGLKHVVWSVALDLNAGGGPVAIRPTATGPTAPTIVVHDDDAADDADSAP